MARVQVLSVLCLLAQAPGGSAVFNTKQRWGEEAVACPRHQLRQGGRELPGSPSMPGSPRASRRGQTRKGPWKLQERGMQAHLHSARWEGHTGSGRQQEPAPAPGDLCTEVKGKHRFRSLLGEGGRSHTHTYMLLRVHTRTRTHTRPP